MATVRPVFDAFDDGHGHSVRRRVFVCPEAAGLDTLQEWRGLRTVLAVETIRSINGSGKAEADVRYFLSSCPDEPTVLVAAIRRHWGIENGLHWVLDVTFREDDSRVRDRIAARNLYLPSARLRPIYALTPVLIDHADEFIDFARIRESPTRSCTTSVYLFCRNS